NAGVALTGASSVGNDILIRNIGNNGGLPIDLGNDGPTANDGGDGDSGPNGLLNFPENLSVGGSTLTGTTCANCQVDLYRAISNPRANGGGGDYLKTVVADANGNWTAFLQCSPYLQSSDTITAVSDQPTGVIYFNTSELSPVSAAVTEPGC